MRTLDLSLNILQEICDDFGVVHILPVQRMDHVIQNIAEVEAEIKSQIEEILRLEAKISALEEQEAKYQDADEKRYLRDKEKQLRDEENKLRDKENKIRDKEKQLRDEKNLFLKRKLQDSVANETMTAAGSTPPDPDDRESILKFGKYSGKSASTFTASNSAVPANCAFNGIFQVSFNLPSIVRTAMEVNVKQGIWNDAEAAIQAGRLFTIFPVKVNKAGSHGPQVVGRTVSKISCVSLKDFFEDRANGLYGLIACALVTIGADIGPASELSCPDLLCVHSASGQTNQAGLLVGEFNDTAYCPLEILGQAFVSAANLMMRQRSLGLQPTEVAVPIILSTGNLMQFAWATTLDPFFPVLSVTSRVLDISDHSDLGEASKALARTKLFCREQANRLDTCQAQEEFQRVAALNKGMYFLKSSQQIFSRYEEQVIGDACLAYL